MWELDHKEGWVLKNWCFWTVVMEKTLESPLNSQEIKSVNPKGNQPWIFIGRTDAKWRSNTLATWCEELTHWERPWCWEILKAGREGDNRGWDGWMASPTQWTWVWVNSGSWWWTERPGVLQSMGSQGVRHNWMANNTLKLANYPSACISLANINPRQFSSVAQSFLTLCNPMDCSMPDFPVLHHLPELAQAQVHWIGEAIQPFHPLSSPSPPTFNLSKHQGLFQWIGSSYQVAKVLELQPQSFQWIFRVDFL